MRRRIREEYLHRLTVEEQSDGTAGVAREQYVRQDAATLSVGHDPTAHRITYKLDGLSHEMASGAVTSVGKAAWEGDRLVIERQDTFPTGISRTLKQVWSLDGAGRLTIESTNVASVGDSQSRKVVYKRKP